MHVSLQSFSMTRDDQNITETLALQDSPLAGLDYIATPISVSTSCDEHLANMHYCSMLHEPPGREQTSLLQPTIQHFVALMPKNSEANSPCTERSCSGSGFETDVGVSMQESGEFDQEFPGTEQIIISLTATQISDSASWLKTHGRVLSSRMIVDRHVFRLASVESMNNSGCLIWKIAQYSQHKLISTEVVSLPFYSGRYGYKMCLRLYIMGDDIGKGTHLSLFFVVMCGEFDNILQWPFTHKVTFKLINQAGGEDIIETFKPNIVKPTCGSDINSAYGCPCFVSHSALEQGGFIDNDDAMFIKCIVDTSTIQHP